MFRSMVDVLASQAAAHPARTAFRFLATGDVDDAGAGVADVSYAALDRRSRAIGAALHERGLAGARAILLHPPGLEFIAAYLGCLAAATVAVPGLPPQGRVLKARAVSRIRRMIADADARVILATKPVIAALDAISEHLPELDEITCVATEDIPDEAGGSWRASDLTADSIAFLQYTSGSTSAPRGVMVTHGNLMDNQVVLSRGMGHTPEIVEEYGGELYVSWLPLYHDLGLIAPVLNNLYLGGTSTLFSPLHFLQKPERWLTALSRYRPHTSGGPNFAYELCLRDATPELLGRLDLSRWRVALNAAEPLRAGTLRRFAETFAPAGFRPGALHPGYGLAEATLMVSGGPVGQEPRTAPAGDGAAADGEWVSCGPPGAGLTVVIADAARRAECPEGEVGEVWVAGASVTQGYWRNARATREVFGASLADGRGGFLRTGDLGFMRDGELYVTGRQKDLLVIDGRNHYPQDIELTVESAHPAVRAGCVAAFSVADEGDATAGERPVVVAEVAAADASAVGAGWHGEAEAAIRGAIGRAHGLALAAVVLIEPGTVPKTSSGKIQRAAARAAYLGGTLAAVGP
ncbi:fatty acyl-AMP ligase [Streptomyces formicae]|uniref:Malonyl CoA-acyl carrier protein transacylase n=1 Tax=Streptomyces formicae TaxID=1616117 RepID=A0A291QJ64_9ACTN|nr:fatty acyl-AMP ligase [Streptomyces formicae]ATL31769.1 Malonyl CoA-acyl carrier protein transacylase [Streptomyces formicae]